MLRWFGTLVLRATGALLLLMLPAGCGAAAGTMQAERVAPAGAAVPAAVRTALESIVRDGVPGVTAIAMRGGRLLFRLDVGAIDAGTRYPVASASKWMTAALAMSVVDSGRLSLDRPIGTLLPEFRGAAAATTLRELLAQISGEGGLRGLVDIRQDPRITLAQSAAEVARRPLAHPPGTVFDYGGPGFQVAGALVEQATGERWATLFDERIARPLGMTHTVWIHLPARGVPPAETLNPLLQGGVVTTADDYMRFLTMLAEGGSVGGRRVLSRQAVATMETIQTRGARMGYLPRGAIGGAQYALGNWCERWDAAGSCTLVSSPGAFGTFPWIDRRSGLYGIFFLRSRFPAVATRLLEARAAILRAYVGG